MTLAARKNAAAIVDSLTAERSEPFTAAQAVLDDAHQMLARLDLLLPTGEQIPSLDLSRQELSDQIDDKLYAEAWRLVSVQAVSLADIMTKVRYVQEFTQVDQTDVESQITLSLCRDLIGLARVIRDKV